MLTSMYTEIQKKREMLRGVEFSARNLLDLHRVKVIASILGVYFFSFLLVGIDFANYLSIVIAFLTFTLLLFADKNSTWCFHLNLTRVSNFLRELLPKQVIPPETIKENSGLIQRQIFPLPPVQVGGRSLVDVNLTPRLLISPSLRLTC